MIAKRYSNLFNLSFEDAVRMAKATNGYSYAYSLLGNIYWDKKNSLTYDEIVAEVKDILEDRAYSQIWDELSPLEKEFLIAMVETDI